jgi:hypothetical protein
MAAGIDSARRSAQSLRTTPSAVDPVRAVYPFPGSILGPELFRPRPQSRIELHEPMLERGTVPWHWKQLDLALALADLTFWSKLKYAHFSGKRAKSSTSNYDAHQVSV